MGPVERIARLFDFKTGARRGPRNELMKPIVASLSVQDLMAVSAYAPSLQPPVVPTPGPVR